MGRADALISVGNDACHETLAGAVGFADRYPPPLARFLIGKSLVRELPEGVAGGRIVETEAYIVGDAAGHAYRGITPRNATLFLERGRAYIYLAYGISHMLNVSSELPGIGAGVLIRAIEPLEGLALMRLNRGIERLRDLARGTRQACRGIAHRSFAGWARSLQGRAAAAGTHGPRTRRHRAEHEDRHFAGSGSLAAILYQRQSVCQRSRIAQPIETPVQAPRRNGLPYPVCLRNGTNVRVAQTPDRPLRWRCNRWVH